MTDLLRMDYINSLPQPFTVKMLGGWEWPVYDIAVDGAMFRIDVCGMLQACNMADAVSFTDASGCVHEQETFWMDYEDLSNTSGN